MSSPPSTIASAAAEKTIKARKTVRLASFGIAMDSKGEEEKELPLVQRFCVCREKRAALHPLRGSKKNKN